MASNRVAGARLLPVVAALLVAGCGGSEPTARSSADAELGVSRKGWKTDFSRHTVPLSEFQSGGPGKDGIPAIDRPRFTAAHSVRFLRPREPVIELVREGEARAYPIQILIWHEIVNDRIGRVPVAVTFCPLCNTALVFDRRVDGRVLDFGTTGNLRHSDLVMYDRQTESWWQQFGGVGVVGRYAGTRLRQLPARIVAWRDFRSRHPNGLVLDRVRVRPLSSESDFLRPYGDNPYEGYDDVSSPPLFSSPAADDDRLSPKERVVFIERGGDAVAIPLSVLRRRQEMEIEVGGRSLVVRVTGSTASPLDSPAVSAGRPIETVDVLENGRRTAYDVPFWFAVAAFRPDVEIVG